jgi:hypothetical protein
MSAAMPAKRTGKETGSAGAGSTKPQRTIAIDHRLGLDRGDRPRSDASNNDVTKRRLGV